MHGQKKKQKHSYNQGTRHHQGIAILMVLVVIALIAGSAATFSGQHRMAMASTRNLLQLGQLQTHMLSGELWAMSLIPQGPLHNSPMAEPNTMEFDLPIHLDGHVHGNISHVQGRFNINNLLANSETTATYQAVFLRLGQIIGLPDQLSQQLVQAIQDGSQTDTYGLVRNEELLLIAGMDKKHLAKLTPHLSFLPPETAININQAPALMLTALDPVIDSAIATNLVKARQANPWQDNEDFFLTLNNQGVELTPQQQQTINATITTQSDYFLLDLQGRIGNLSKHVKALLHANSEKKVSVLSRYGALHE